MLRKEEEFNEGKKDAGVDLKNKLPMRDIYRYPSIYYQEGYLSIYPENEEEDKKGDKK